MYLVTSSIITATITYVAYNAIALAIFGVPQSLSETYYLYKKSHGMGFLFPTMMALVVAFMMPAWITMSEGSPFQFLSFLAPASILFVGAAPAFKSSSLENSVHSISALIAAACSLAWVCLITPYWWEILVWGAIAICFAILTKTYKTSCVYWLETIALGATFTSAIIYSM